MQELLIWKFYYENGFSCAEIGEKIGISESNTKVKLFRMRQKLKAVWRSNLTGRGMKNPGMILEG